MLSAHQSHRTQSSERSAPHSRWFGRALAAGALLTAGLALAACGKSSDSSSPPTILNTEKVERAIERSSLDQRRKRVHVSCPSGVHQKAGLVFFCTAVYEGRDTRFVVTQRDGSGRVRYEAR